MPTKFQIWSDDANVKPTENLPVVEVPAPPRFIPDTLTPNQRFYFDERKIYPIDGGEFSFEELNYSRWLKLQRQILDKLRLTELLKENEELKQKIEVLTYELAKFQNQNKQPTKPHAPPSPLDQGTSCRLSIVPQSLQPAQGLEYNDASCRYGALCDAPTVVEDLWRDTGTLPIPTSAISEYRMAHSDKFTLPIDQSQFIRENVPTSTPNTKGPDVKRGMLHNNNRRMSRPSTGGGSPTLKLSPITETSRECNSKSSSSSSGLSATPGTAKKIPILEVAETVTVEEPDRPLDPNDPSTYRQLLRGLSEPLERRQGYFKLIRSLPKIRQGACFQAGSDNYLVDKELSSEAKMFTAQLLSDDDSSAEDLPTKTVCFRVDQPANEWLFYISNELHRRLVKQKTSPDIELSVMIANPAVIYSDGSILVDEYFRYVTLQHFLDACIKLKKPFPKSVAAFITLELIQLVRQMHTCDVVHMNIHPKNILITCCPTRDDIASVRERTSIVKLIGFDRAMDGRLLPPQFKFNVSIEDMNTCEMLDFKPWFKEIDWFGTLRCIHKMFFLENMEVDKVQGRWTVGKQFKGCPTEVWGTLFDELLNIQDMSLATKVIENATEELNNWVTANISFLLKESDSLDQVLVEYCKENNRSIRT